MDTLKRFSSRAVGISVCLGAALLAMGASEPQRRLRGDINSNETFTLTGNTRPALTLARDQGEVDGTLPLTWMTLPFTLSTAQLADQQQLIKQLTARKSSQYHKWLTPEQYAARFGVNSNDIERVSAWLAQQGFLNIEVARSHTSISFSGTAAQAQSAFRTSIHHYVTGDGNTHYANAVNPTLPKALQGMVAGIRGLNDLHPKPHARPHFTSSISGSNYLTPNDFATIYDLQPLYGNGIDGTGQTIAVLGQSDIALSDIEAFRTAAGLPQNDPQIILAGRKDPGIVTDDESESDLDLEWAGGVAKGATIIFVTSTDVLNTSLTYAIENNVAPVISITYGNCEAILGEAEADSLNTVLMQAATQGQTVIAASGDAGAADCDTLNTAHLGLAVDFPASSPYVTGLGGTAFNEGTGSYWNTTNNAYGGSAISYIPEIVWNDTSTTAGLSASGGGASMFFSKPTWQTGTGVPNDDARDVPDLALAASPSHDGLLYCTAGSCVTGFRGANDMDLTVVGGTSAASPTFAAIVALLNQQTKSSQGNINPTLYSLASFSTDAFHDITSGNNVVPCEAASLNCPASLAMGFLAGTGYDQVTGLGSVDAYNLIREWTGDFSIAASPTTLSITRGASASVLVTASAEGNFTGAVSFTCTVATSLTNTTCSIPGTLSGAGVATLTITTGANATAPGWWRIGKLPWQMIGVSWLLALSGFFYLWKSGKLKAGRTVCAFALLAVLTGCGDGGSNSNTVTPVTPVTTSETGTVTINATSGTLTNSATISVTVS